MKRIPIVGGGVIGARVAWHVAARGVGDAWRGRNIHAAMLDSLRLCEDLRPQIVAGVSSTRGSTERP